jgi:hypothetical protein
MWLNTQRLTAVLLSEPVLSNVWWPLKLRDGLDDRHAKVLTLWLNSTLGLFLLLANRVETRGAWVQFKKAGAAQPARFGCAEVEGGATEATNRRL